MKFEFPKFKKKEKIEQPKPEKELFKLWDIKYAFQYKGAMLNKEEIELLANNHFTREALYLVFKNLADNPENQKKFLEKYVSSVFNENSLINKEELEKELVIESLKNETEVSVKAAKLSQLNRHGFNYWQELYKAKAEILSNDQRNVYMLAHSTFIGLEVFLKAFQKQKKDLNILVPGWEQSEQFGYVINFSGEKLSLDWLHKPLDNKEGSILFDDTKNTGNTLQEAQKFLKKNGARNPEMIVIDNAG